MNGVLIAAAVVGILGIIIGIFLGVSGAKFEVKVDERETLVREQLPGNNCGGCGYAGCDACAKAIVEGKAPWDPYTAENHIHMVIDDNEWKPVHSLHAKEDSVFRPMYEVLLND